MYCAANGTLDVQHTCYTDSDSKPLWGHYGTIYRFFIENSHFKSIPFFWYPATKPLNYTFWMKFNVIKQYPISKHMHQAKVLRPKRIALIQILFLTIFQLLSSISLFFDFLSQLIFSKLLLEDVRRSPDVVRAVPITQQYTSYCYLLYVR